MAGMRELLEEMVSKGASDLHLTAGLPPQYRIDGLVGSSDFPVLTGEETMRLAYSILNEEQKKTLVQIYESFRAERRAAGFEPDFAPLMGQDRTAGDASDEAADDDRDTGAESEALAGR